MWFASDSPAEGGRTALSVFRAITRRLAINFELIPGLVALGLLAALADAIAVGLVVALLFALLSQPPTDGLLGQVLDAVEKGFGPGWAGLAGCLVLFVLTKVAISFCYQALTIRFKNDVNTRVLAGLHSRLLEMRYSDLRMRGQGELLNAAATDSWQVANAAYLLSRIAISACALAVFAVLILATSWIVAVIALTGGILIALLSQFQTRYARKAGLRARSSINRLYLGFLVAVQSARLIRAFAAEEGLKRQFHDQARHLRRHLVRAETIQSLSAPINELAYVLLMIALVTTAKVFAVPTPTALTAVALIYRMAPHAREIESNRHAFAGLFASLKGVFGLLTQEPVWRAAARPAAIGGCTIRFEEVSYRLPGSPAPVLDRVSFSIPAGETVVLSGPSGSGKTTIVNLLLRLYDPDGGVIRVGSAPLSSIKTSDWLAQVSVAGQDIDVIEGTVADNLRLGAPGAGLDDLREAAKAAGVLDFIESLPDRFETWIGSFGYNLSGGQRQRISIARAVLRNPHLLILDEGTNAIEDSLESDILGAIRQKLPKAAMLIITHRPSELCAGNRILRLMEGRIVSPIPSLVGAGSPPAERAR